MSVRVPSSSRGAGRGPLRAMPRARTRTSLLRHPHALDAGVAVAAFALAAMLPLMLQQRPKYALVAVFGLLTLAAGLMFRPSLVAVVFGWLVLAPFLQEPARASNVGHQLQYVLYELPPLLFLVWAWWLRGHRRVEVRASAPDVLPFLLFAFAVAGVLLSSQPAGDTFTRLHDVFWNVGLGVLVYYLLAFAPLGRAEVETITLGVLAATTFAALVAIAQYAAGFSIWGSAASVGSGATTAAGTLNNQGVASAVGTLGNPAVLGTVAGVGSVFAVSLLTWGGPVRWRRLASLSLPVTLTAVVLSFERTPIIVTVVLILAVVVSRRRLRLRALVMVALLGAAAAIMIPRLATAPAYQQRATNAAGVDVRLRVFRRSLQLAQVSPVLGNGYGTYDTVSREKTLATSTTDSGDVTGVTSHNTLLTMLVEVGLTGIALLLAHWLWVIAGAVRALRRKLMPPWLAAAWLSGLAAVGMNAMAIDVRFFSFVCVVPWICLGLLRRSHQAG